MTETEKLRIISFFNRSMAFLKIAHISSLQKNEETFLTEDYQNVIVYLCYHAFELFLKFSILSRCSDIDEVQKTLKSFNHDINELYRQYTFLYSEQNYAIHNPFHFSIDLDNVSKEEKILWENHMNNYSPKYFDQFMKYPMDKKGKYTGGAYTIHFDAQWIAKFKNELSTIGNELINTILNRYD